MSNNYRWKDKYYDVNGAEVLPQQIVFYSLIGNKNGNGTKENPLNNKSTSHAIGIAIASGQYNSITTKDLNRIVIGENPFNTTVLNVFAFNNGTTSLYDGITINNQITIGQYRSSTYVNFRNCILNGKYYLAEGRCTITNCLIKKDQDNPFYNSSNSILNIETLLSTILAGNYNLFVGCDIIITNESVINKTLNTLYLAFSNCRFKIAEETEYTPLVGNTEEELRADFAARCEAQGIVVPEGSELNDPKIKLYRWVFSNDKNDHGYVIKDSIIDKFQQRRMIRFGWKDEPVSPIEITTDTTIINSLSTKTEEILIDDENQSIRFADNIDIANMDNGVQTGKVRSNIIWMGEGKQKLDSVNIFHNLATQYGVMIDSDPAIVPVGRNSIEGGQMYLVRTKAAGKQSIIYNEKSYSTSLADANNIFVGVDGVNDWICDDYDSIVIYKITDLAISNTIRMRIVDEIPEDTITSVAKDLWYFVQPKDLSNPSGSVIYNGAEYPCFGSFKAGNETSFQIKGDCRLRRCWKDDFELSTDSDKSFWENKQKPIWFDVVPDDMRCLLKKNNPLSVEMEWDKDRNTYITSGHPDFYAMVAADNGVPRPAYDITGKYLQIELVISTLNPM